MIQFYKLIRERRAQAARQAERLRKVLAGLESEIAEIDAFLERHPGPDIPGPPDPKTVRRANPTRKKLVETVREILDEAGRPVPRREMLERLRQAGCPMTGKDPAMNLTMALRRAGPASGIVNRERVGYWFADRPYPGDDLPVPEP